MDTPWSAPALSDFTSDAWSDVPADEKRQIAGHFAWARTMPPDTYGDLKLPHHEASGSGKVVWRGVANAAARLPQSSIPDADMDKVKAHLGRHYHAFSKVPPWEDQAAAWDEYTHLCRAVA